MRLILKIAAGALMALAVFLFGVKVVAVGWFIVMPMVQNPGYAARVFDDVVPVDAVLASRIWHRSFAQP